MIVNTALFTAILIYRPACYASWSFALSASTPTLSVHGKGIYPESRRHHDRGPVAVTLPVGHRRRPRSKLEHIWRARAGGRARTLVVLLVVAAGLYFVTVHLPLLSELEFKLVKGAPGRQRVQRVPLHAADVLAKCRSLDAKPGTPAEFGRRPREQSDRYDAEMGAGARKYWYGTLQSGRVWMAERTLFEGTFCWRMG